MNGNLMRRGEYTTDTRAQRNGHVKTQEEDGHRQAKERERPQEKSTLLEA